MIAEGTTLYPQYFDSTEMYFDDGLTLDSG